MNADANLVAIVGKDPRDNSPAFYYAHKSITPAVYPQITFRESTLDLDFRVRSAAVDWQYYSFELWTNEPKNDTIDRMRRELDNMFNHSRFAMPDAVNNYLFYMERVPGGSPSNYDSGLKAYFGLYRYRAKTAAP